MEYKEIVSVTGMGGLFQLLGTKSDGAIVRNIADNSTKFISARVHNVTPLDSIEVYTTEDNVRLQEIFKLMKDSETKHEVLDPKGAGNDDIKSYFKTVVPDIDEDRVYVSDMKKILKWYTLLNNHDLLTFEEVTEEEEPEATEEVAEEKPKKKAATKKKAAEKSDDEKPAKKTAAKKKAAKADDKEKPVTKKATAKKKKTEE